MTQPQGPLARRIAARKGEPVQSPVAVAEREPVKVARWIAIARESTGLGRDETGRVLS